MMTQLLMAGKLDQPAGVLLGDFTRCDDAGPRDFREIATEVFRHVSYPVVMAKSQTVLPVFFNFNNCKEQLLALGREKALMGLGIGNLAFQTETEPRPLAKGSRENAS